MPGTSRRKRPAPAGKPPIVTLTTDFGLAGPYVGAMKGVILSLNRDAVIIDVTHGVRPQQLLQAVFLTQSAWPFFPPDAIHVVVVDPGVGTDRRAIALNTPKGCFIGPDNGVLSAALPDAARPSGDEPSAVELPSGYRAWAITHRRYMREPVSATFHGRDIFAPAAAHLSLGVPPSELGEPVDTMTAFPVLRARRSPDGALLARVIHIDRFGNVITNVRADDLPSGSFTIEVAGRRVAGPVRTYAEASGLAAIAGSSGYVEVALAGGSAAEALGVDIDDAAVLRPDS